jgi:hypothetical protein
MLRPSQSRPTPPKKAKAKTKPTPPKKAKTKNARAKTTMTEMTTASKKAGRHPDNNICVDSFGDLCMYRGFHGTMKVPQTNSGKNQPLYDWVHYSRKRKARDEVVDHYVAVFNGINFDWATGQSPRWQFKVCPMHLVTVK